MKDKISSISKKMNIDPNLVSAIITVESNFNQYAIRYEPGFSYRFKAKEFAFKLGISHATEGMLQSCSWGLMQIMGCVAREHGFNKSLLELIDIETNIYHGCLELRSLLNIYSFDDAISAYNAGSPVMKIDGSYVNQIYVDKVKFYVKAN